MLNKLVNISYYHIVFKFAFSLLSYIIVEFLFKIIKILHVK